MNLSGPTKDLANLDMAIVPSSERVRQHAFEPELQSHTPRSRTHALPGLLRHFIQFIVVAVLAAGSYWFFSRNVLQSVEVVGTSMLPTLHNQDYYLLNKWTYLLRDPQPSDIVVIRDPDDGKYSVKRIVGCAGDSILLKDGKVYVNGRELVEPYLEPGTPTYARLTRKGDQWVVCGKDNYFVMGDNRKNSEDSRSFGTVPRKNIVGAVVR